MNLIDTIIVLNKDNEIIDIKSKSNYFNEISMDLIRYHFNKHISTLLDIDFMIDKGFTTLNGNTYFYELIEYDTNTTFLLLKNNIPDSILFEKVFDTLHEGVHIYDKNAHLMYFNNASENISLSENSSLIGKHLTDIFPNVKENQSTLLNTLRTKKPIINRCETFETNAGNITTTVNTGYPIIYDDKLLGSVVIERDITSLRKSFDELDMIKNLIYEQVKYSNNIKSLTKFNFTDLIGKNKLFLDAINLAKKISAQDCNILICGETGTGKELFAQSIHQNSNRKNKNFVALNCAAIPETLIEGILFGTTKGAFTGSMDKIGLFEDADGGTLFLDELNSMSLTMQAKLLRVIQDGTFRKVGDKNDIRCNVRIISSCNENPFSIIERNVLRKDLFYRLSTFMIEIPTLRKRVDDIEVLLEYFIDKLSHKYLKKVTYISSDVIKLLKNYSWPGNVREFMHAMEYALNLIDGNKFEVIHLPKYLLGNLDNTSNGIQDYDDDIFDNDLQFLMDKHECEILKKVLDHNGYNISKSALSLGLKRQSLQYRIKKYGIII